ncbi:MAG: ABC transporter permease [Dehalococcoidales bacterium]|nr:ABC transporter permease [Dehalococcoidales bacterium]
MKRALILALNEVRLYLRDKGDLAFTLLLPIVTFALMYGAFGGASRFNATAYVVDEDGGMYARSLVEGLGRVEGVKVSMLSTEKALARLQDADLNFVLFIPAGFSERLASEGRAELVFRQRGNGGQTGQVLGSIIRGIARDMERDIGIYQKVRSNLAGTGIAVETIDVVVTRLLEEERGNPSVRVKEELTGGTGELVNQYVPSILTMYVLFALMVGARAIVEERRKGTLERLLTTRLSVGELFFGKYIAGIGRGFVQTFILLALSYAVFRMFTPASFLQSLCFVFVYIAAVSALSLVLASVSRTEDAANWIGIVFTMATVILGGTFFEVSEGSLLHTLGRFSINTYANEALKKIIAEGASLGDVVPSLLIFVGVAVVGLILSRLIFRAVSGAR